MPSQSEIRGERARDVLTKKKGGVDANIFAENEGVTVRRPQTEKFWLSRANLFAGPPKVARVGPGVTETSPIQTPF